MTLSTVLFCAAPVLAQDIPPRLALVVGPSEYYGVTYVEDPTDRADYLFYTSESVGFIVSIANRGSLDDELVLQRPGGLPNALAVEAVRDGRAVAVPLKLRGAFAGRADLAGASEVTRVTLEPGEKIMWQFEVAGRLPPGVYEVTFQSDAMDTRSRKVSPMAPSLRFEVRRETRADAIELLRRRATKRLADGDLQGASNSATELLQAHPQSFEANIILGSVAEKRQSADVAKQYFERAVALLERNEDALALKYRNAEVLKQTRAHLAGRAGRTPQ